MLCVCCSFIVDHYTPGSRIWLFGLSRGAYTVRAVAGMINNCGIIKPGTGGEGTAAAAPYCTMFKHAINVGAARHSVKH